VPRVIHERDLRTDIFASGINSPVSCRITHVPSGVIGSATDKSRIKAERQAREMLTQALAMRALYGDR
jgi:protein subunit release factor A